MFNLLLQGNHLQSLPISNYHVKHTSHLKDYRAIGRNNWTNWRNASTKQPCTIQSCQLSPLRNYLLRLQFARVCLRGWLMWTYLCCVELNSSGGGNGDPYLPGHPLLCISKTIRQLLYVLDCVLIHVLKL